MNEDYQGPKNLQSLFKFCITADDGKNLKSSNIDPVEAAEKTKWLKNFMAETCVNIGQRTQENMKILYEVIGTGKLSENTLFVLEELQDITEHIEFSKDFIKMGGLELIRNLLGLKINDILTNTCELLANVTQNDDSCQSAAISAGLVPLLLEKIETSSNGLIVKKMVYALSCCIRGHPEGVQVFKAANGIHILLESMLCDQGEAGPKCSFLLFCLVKDCDDVNTILSEHEFRDITEKVLKLSLDVNRTEIEYLMGVISHSLKQQSSFQTAITSDFRTWLSRQLILVKDQTEHEELIGYINQITELYPIT